MSSAICVDHQLSQIPSRKLLMISKCNETGGGAHYDHEDDIDCDDPYSSDHFRMYEFKVRRCTRSRSHDWTDCPFVHPGEKARRRDPRKYHYSGEVCPEFRQGGECRRGDNCEFAHGVFECWLHPSRYRTEACKDGKSCKRKICFFAHTPRQLRILPEVSSKRSLNKINSPCSTCLLRQSLLSSSPTSTLLGLSPPMSPSSPLSPAKHRSPLSGFSPISRYNDRLSKIMSYENMVNELMSSLEAVSFNDYEQEYAGFSPSSSGSGDFFNNGEFMDESKINLGASYDDPDLGWVNELLM